MTGLNTASKADFIAMIEAHDPQRDADIFEFAKQIRIQNFCNRVYVRGLIEISSHCKNNCYYCGLRRGNAQAERYRLTDVQILDCCEAGDALGFRTFVLQGGEDTAFTDTRLCRLLEAIKTRWPGCAVTLSLGERSRESYRTLKNAGADRYLLRHESADDAHYGKLHPSPLSFKSRKRCLYDLKELGYQTGAGFMVGSPYQTAETLAGDLLFLRELQPHMVGIGPFLPHHGTPFASFPAGNLKLTLRMLALTRILLPQANLPATTALATLAENGRELGFSCGANVVMPNLSPVDVRSAYNLYDGKLNTGAEAAEGLRALETRLDAAGFAADLSRGDWCG